MVYIGLLKASSFVRTLPFNDLLGQVSNALPLSATAFGLVQTPHMTSKPTAELTKKEPPPLVGDSIVRLKLFVLAGTLDKVKSTKTKSAPSKVFPGSAVEQFVKVRLSEIPPAFTLILAVGPQAKSVTGTLIVISAGSVIPVSGILKVSESLKKNLLINRPFAPFPFPVFSLKIYKT